MAQNNAVKRRHYCDAKLSTMHVRKNSRRKTCIQYKLLMWMETMLNQIFKKTINSITQKRNHSNKHIFIKIPKIEELF